MQPNQRKRNPSKNENESCPNVVSSSELMWGSYLGCEEGADIPIHLQASRPGRGGVTEKSVRRQGQPTPRAEGPTGWIKSLGPNLWP